MNLCYKSTNLIIINLFSHGQVIFITSNQHVYNINTSRTTWKCFHVCRVNRDCPRGHMLVTDWSKNALLRNLPGESKRAGPLQVSQVVHYNAPDGASSHIHYKSCYHVVNAFSIHKNTPSLHDFTALILF